MRGLILPDLAPLVFETPFHSLPLSFSSARQTQSARKLIIIKKKNFKKKNRKKEQRSSNAEEQPDHLHTAGLCRRKRRSGMAAYLRKRQVQQQCQQTQASSSREPSRTRSSTSGQAHNAGGTEARLLTGRKLVCAPALVTCKVRSGSDSVGQLRTLDRYSLQDFRPPLYHMRHRVRKEKLYLVDTNFHKKT